MIYLTLIYEFFKIGLFAIGGGLATIPFLSELINRYHWFTTSMLADMIAVSESTPGAIGINMATFAGFHTAGVWGGILATLGLIAPSIMIICIVAKLLKQFKDSPLIAALFYGLRPAVTALIASAGLNIFVTALFHMDALQDRSINVLTLFNLPCIVLFVILYYLSNRYKKLHPIVWIASAAVIGIVFQL
ncbi:MAG: chromate transporter [Erysipelotrichaceae bacterium]|nr:chromate transporter [Erysipelotrichaceae bacterium]